MPDSFKQHTIIQLGLGANLVKQLLASGIKVESKCGEFTVQITVDDEVRKVLKSLPLFEEPDKKDSKKVVRKKVAARSSKRTSTNGDKT